MTCAVALALLLAAPPLSFAERVEGARAVERARYAFVIGATKPFDEVYPRSVFEKKVERELAEERVLASSSGWRSRPNSSRRSTSGSRRRPARPNSGRRSRRRSAAPAGRSRKSSAGPLLVDRVLRARFAFDQTIHAAEHQKARLAREAFLAGKTPAGTKLLRLSRRGEEAAEGTDEMLARARADATGPKVLSPAGPEPKEDRPLALDPEMAKVLEKELKAKGDVTTILEERNRFSVFRLVTPDAGEWLVDAVQIPKRDFDRWLDAAVKTAKPSAGLPRH